MPWAPAKDLADAKAFLERCIQGEVLRQEKTYFLELRRDPGAPVGHITVRAAHPGTAELGYVLAPEHWNKGLMSEAVQALVALVLANGEFQRIQATCGVVNTASLRTLEKAGFLREERLRQHLVHPLHGPEPVDAWLYTKTLEYGPNKLALGAALNGLPGPGAHGNASGVPPRESPETRRGLGTPPSDAPVL